MMRPGDIWGACPYRELLISRGRGHYICVKADTVCDPNYCLGPDEEVDDEPKGETHE